MEIKEYIQMSGFITGTFLIGYYMNDMKNVPVYPGYQNTFKGLDDHLVGIMTGIGIIGISLVI